MDNKPACEEYKLPRWLEVVILVIALILILGGFSCYTNVGGINHGNSLDGRTESGYQAGH